MVKYAVGDRVRVKCKTLDFVGEVRGEMYGGLIVKPDAMTPEIEAKRNNSYDPHGCLIVNICYVRAYNNGDKVND